jgi:hypothetical protein
VVTTRFNHSTCLTMFALLQNGAALLSFLDGLFTKLLFGEPMTMELVNISADLALALILVSVWIVLSIEWPLWSSGPHSLTRRCDDYAPLPCLPRLALLSLCRDFFVVLLSLQ